MILPSMFLQRTKNGFDLRLIFWILIFQKSKGSFKEYLRQKVLQSVAAFTIKNADFCTKSRKSRKLKNEVQDLQHAKKQLNAHKIRDLARVAEW